MRRVLSIESMCKRAMALLRDPRTSVRVVPLDATRRYARSEFKIKVGRAGVSDGGGPIKLSVDTFQAGLCPAVLHELAHVMMSAITAPMDSNVEEAAIRSWGDEMWWHIRQNPKLTSSWRKAIAEKLL